MAKEPRSLSGKVVAITGGGRGIGRATALALAREGARVAVGDLDREAAESVAAELGDGALGLSLDVTDHAGFTAFLDEVEQQLGPLDVLVNNAGIMPVTPLVEETPESISRQLEINLHAVIHGTQEAMRRMVPRRSGHIVQLSSIAGRTGLPHLATYCATKHGVFGLSEAVRAELRGSGVEVSVVMPVDRAHRADGGPRRGARRQDGGAGGGRAGDRVRAQEAALRRLHPSFDRAAGLPRRCPAAAAFAKPSPARWGPIRHSLKTDRAARAAYEARAAASAPAAEHETV